MHLLYKAVVLSVYGVSVGSSTALAQDADLSAQRQSVVKIRIRREGRPDETAAGVIVGWTEQNTYYATAYHAVASDTGTVQSLRLQLHTSPDTVDGEIFPRFDAVLDLAVIRTATHTGASSVSGGNPRPGAAIQIVGHPAAGEWSVWAGSIQNENAANGDIEHFVCVGRALPTNGFSGGGVFDSTGRLLGIHSETAGGVGIGVKFSEMLRRLTAWSAPTNAIVPAPSTSLPMESSSAVSAEARPTQCYVAAVQVEPTSFGGGNLTVQFTKPLNAATLNKLDIGNIDIKIAGSSRFIKCSDVHVVDTKLRSNSIQTSSVSMKCSTTTASSPLGDNIDICFHNIGFRTPNGKTTLAEVCGSTSTDWGPFGRDPGDSQSVLRVSLDPLYQTSCGGRFELCVAQRQVTGEERQLCSEIHITPNLVFRASLYSSSLQTFLRLGNPGSAQPFVEKEVTPQLRRVTSVVLPVRAQ
jgi:hypothetical protein